MAWRNLFFAALELAVAAVQVLRLIVFRSSVSFFFSAQRKIIRSNFTLDMTNDTITLAAIWEEKLRPPNYKKKADL